MPMMMSSPACDALLLPEAVGAGRGRGTSASTRCRLPQLVLRHRQHAGARGQLRPASGRQLGGEAVERVAVVVDLLVPPWALISASLLAFQVLRIGVRGERCRVELATLARLRGRQTGGRAVIGPTVWAAHGAGRCRSRRRRCDFRVVVRSLADLPPARPNAEVTRSAASPTDAQSAPSERKRICVSPLSFP